MISTWVLILVVTFGHQEVPVGHYASEELCHQVAMHQIGRFSPYSIFESYRCEKVGP
jgi:hypothetical protein